MSIRFGIIGGDARQVYLAQALQADGHTVVLSALEKAPGAEAFEMLLPEKLGACCEVIVLPLPVIRDGLMNTALSAQKIELTDALADSFQGCRVLGGIIDKLPQTAAWQALSPIDYYEREELVVGYAALTAEAAVAIAIQELPISLCNARCLVTGFGRIGKALCDMLRSLYAQVDCAARKDHDFMMIQNIGCRPIRYDEIGGRYDIIFNTVPTQVLGEPQLAAQDADTVILELASAPGGVDLEAAKAAGIRIIDGQSLPGRVSPKTSGEYLKQAIGNILEE